VIVDWFKAQSRRAYALLAESAGRRASRELAEWVEAHGGSVSVRELTHGRRAFRGDSAVAREALDRLVKEGVGRWAQDAPTKKGGRPAERFELVTTVTVTETPRHDAPEGVMVTVTPVTPPENDNGPPVDEVLFDVGLKPAGAIEP
ncbi:MAG: hypothetical protein IIB55_09860, partial [Planctomycetes bacterium]|nr:hypothetical protein [Planctomycetota bacterium]